MMDAPIPMCKLDPGECAVLPQFGPWGAKYLITDMQTGCNAHVVPYKYMIQTMTVPDWAINPKAAEAELRCTLCFQECERVDTIYEELERKKEPTEVSFFRAPLPVSPQDREKRARIVKSNSDPK